MELKKIALAQSIRNRSQSMVPSSSNAPVLPQVKNFGHRRRSNLVLKAQQLQSRGIRSKSIAISDINTKKLIMLNLGNNFSQPDFGGNIKMASELNLTKQLQLNDNCHFIQIDPKHLQPNGIINLTSNQLASMIMQKPQQDHASILSQNDRIPING